MTDPVGAAASAPVSAHAAAARADDLDRRYRRVVLDYCVHRLRSREEGEDAAQTVFLNAYRSLAKGTEPQSERAWLFTIAQHVVSHKSRVNSRRLRFEVPVDVDDLAYLAVAPSLEDAPDLTGLSAALSEMPTLQRRALLLREWRGLTYQEVAGELGVSTAVVEMLLARGRHRLADRLQDLRRTGKQRVLGLCLPWPSLQSLIGSGAAVKGLAGVASVVFLTASLPMLGPATQAPARPMPASRPSAAPAPAQPTRSQRPSSRGSTPTLAPVRWTDTQAAHAYPAASPPAPTIPAEEAAPATAAADVGAPAADTTVAVGAPAADTTVAATAASRSALDTPDRSTEAPVQSQRRPDLDPAAQRPTPTIPPPAAAPPAQNNSDQGQDGSGAAAATERGSSADNTAASSQ